MRARLIVCDDVFQVLLCTGKIRTVDMKGAYAFLHSYDDPSHYSGSGKWNDKIGSMRDYRGQTIAIVDDNGVLQVESAEHFRNILDNGQPELMTASEYAERYEKAETRVRRLCREGRLPGAQLKGTVWLIPENTPYPSDERMRDGRRWGGRK